MKNKNSILNTIVEFILRKKTLNAILFVIVGFLISELAAYSQGDEIRDACDKILEGTDNSFLIICMSIIRIFFTDGSMAIIVSAFLVLIPFLFLKFVELTDNKDNFKVQFIAFCGVLLFCVWGILFILSKFSFEEDNSLIFFDPGKTSENLGGNSWRFTYSYKVYGNGVINLRGTQVNNRYEDWEGYIEFHLIDGSGRIIRKIQTKKYQCPARSAVSDGARVQNISFDTIINNQSFRDIKLIRTKEFGYEID